jgi:hypothetical protein
MRTDGRAVQERTLRPGGANGGAGGRREDPETEAVRAASSGQNSRLRAGIERETEGVTLVSMRHSAPQFPLHPYIPRQF